MKNDPVLNDLIWTNGEDILTSRGMAESRNYCIHGYSNVYDHSLSVAAVSLRLARFLHEPVDDTALIRGALLHDYFLYDWHDREKYRMKHGFTHARTALHNAVRDFAPLGTVEKDIILRHMFPLNPHLTGCRESWLVCCADKYCAGRERIGGLLHKHRRKAGRKAAYSA